MAQRPKKVTTIADVAYLLEKADIAIKKTKRDAKKPKGCKNHSDRIPIYKGLCQECLDKDRDERIGENMKKRWFSTDGAEYTYNSEGKVVRYTTQRMEQLLGRKLFSYERVGRKDGDKRNNEDDNLLLIASPGVNLLDLHCRCGLPYFHKEEGPLEHYPDSDK